MIGFLTGGEARDVSPFSIDGNGFGSAPGVWLSRSATINDSGEGCFSAPLGASIKGCSAGRALRGRSSVGLPVILLGVAPSRF